MCIMTGTNFVPGFLSGACGWHVVFGWRFHGAFNFPCVPVMFFGEQLRVAPQSAPLPMSSSARL